MFEGVGCVGEEMAPPRSGDSNGYRGNKPHAEEGPLFRGTANVGAGAEGIRKYCDDTATAAWGWGGGGADYAPPRR